MVYVDVGALLEAIVRWALVRDREDIVEIGEAGRY